MIAPTLEVENLTKVFGGRQRVFGLGDKGGVRAVEDVSFVVQRGETLGIVGESGSGKSTTARLLLRLIEPSAGTIRLNGEDVRAWSRKDLRHRRRHMQMIFQDPYASLNPRLSIGYQLAEPLIVHGLCSGGDEAKTRVAQLLTRVGLNPQHAASYPHQFSGGQRQRIAIARALSVEPDLIVADEAVSALDVSIRAQILNLMDEIRRGSSLSMLFISHDLGVVRHVADRVAVMFRGRIVEIGPVADVFREPRHPYTRELLEAMPIPDPSRRRKSATPRGPAGDTRDGCSFRGRCPLTIEACHTEQPPLASVGEDRKSACFRPHDVAPFDTEAARITSPAAARLRALQDRYGAAAGIAEAG